jgi:hypothetical protein
MLSSLSDAHTSLQTLPFPCTAAVVAVQGPGATRAYDKPVWLQVPRYHRSHPNQEVAQQAVAALAESPLLQELPVVTTAVSAVSGAESAVG